MDDNKVKKVSKVLGDFLKHEGLAATPETIDLMAEKTMEFLIEREKNTQKVEFAFPFPENQTVTIENIQALAMEIVKYLPKPVEEVQIKNPTEFPDEIRVSNFPLPPNPPTKLDVSNFPAVQDVKVLNQVELPTEIKANLDEYTKQNKPLAVRLSNGKQFIEALGEAVGQQITMSAMGMNNEILPKELNHGQISTTSGVATPLSAAPLLCRTVSVQAHPANSAYIYIGGAAITPQNAPVLQAGESKDIEIDDASRVYITSESNQRARWLIVR